MSARTWGKTSQGRRATLAPALQVLVDSVLQRHEHDISITCGHRTQAEQDAAVARGTSRARWPTSKHNKLPSHAVDLAVLVDGRAVWDLPSYERLWQTAQACWAEMVESGLVPPGVTLHWGGHFRGLVDGPHFELRGGAYGG